MVKLHDNNKMKLQLLLLAKEIREENTDIDDFFPLNLASRLQLPTPSSSLNRKFLSSKQGRVKHQLRDVLSLQMPLFISLQANCPSSGGFLCLSLKTSTGLSQST